MKYRETGTQLSHCRTDWKLLSLDKSNNRRKPIASRKNALVKLRYL